MDQDKDIKKCDKLDKLSSRNKLENKAYKESRIYQNIKTKERYFKLQTAEQFRTNCNKAR